MAISARLEELKTRFEENPRRYFAPLANEYRKLGDLAQAIALCRTHLPHQPGHISGNIVLAQALFESGNLIEARRSFEAALEMDPENLIALRHLGDIARQEGATDAAQAWYQRVLDADPRNDEIAQLLHDLAGNGKQAPSADLVPPPAALAAEPPATPPAVAAPRVPVLVPPAYYPEPEAAEPPPSVEARPAAAAPPVVEPTPEPVGLAQAPVEPAPVEHPPTTAQADDWFRLEPTDGSPQHAGYADGFLPDLSEAATLPLPSEPRMDDFLGEPDAPAEPVLQPPPAAEPLPQATPAIGGSDFATLGWPDVDGDDSIAPSAPEARQDAVPAAEPEVPEVEPTTPAWQSPPAADAGDAVYWDVEPVSTRKPTPWDALVVPGAPETPTPTPEPSLDLGFSVLDEGADGQLADPLIGRTPEFSRPVVEQPPAPFVTETMAELYLQQGFNEEALAIYQQLLAQSPDDPALQRRVAALQEGSGSAVVGPDLGVPAVQEPEVTVRAFFARFATRARRDRGSPRAAAPNAGDAEDERSGRALGGAATREEALTRPDDAPASLVGLFRGSDASSSDAHAASTLASAFDVAPAEGESSGELSLGHLFRDVEAHSAGAVTAGETAPDPMPASPDAAAGGEVESHADIEQFTAWLEGLKKK